MVRAAEKRAGKRRNGPDTKAEEAKKMSEETVVQEVVVVEESVQEAEVPSEAEQAPALASLSEEPAESPEEKADADKEEPLEEAVPGEMDRLLAEIFSEELEQNAVEQMFRWAGEDGRVEQENGELSGMALLESVHHGRHVAALALRLFEALSLQHGLDARWAAVLAQAALWHDLGFAVGGRRGHHKRSMRIIEENRGLTLSFGLEESERPVVALLARYHRRAWPSARHRRFAALPQKEQKALARAAAILRVADALDFTHKGAVEDMRISVRRRSVRIVCLGSCSCRKECRHALKKGDLFEKLFDRKLELSQEKAGSGDER